MGGILKNINSPDDIKKLSLSDMNALARELRIFLVNTISKTGGHLASNLGVVELTLALHYCFDTPYDKIIWDVGHQCYIHKIITGRKKSFSTLRQSGGISGFPKPEESPHDSFAAGHSSTSISAALGFACARDLAGDKNSVIAVIGDGSITGGLAFEGLNNAGRSNRNIIVILNDNQMSIDNNVGAVSRHLNDLRIEPAYLGAKEGVHNILDKIPVFGEPLDRGIEKVKNGLKYILVQGVMFEEMGFRYIGPIDGHNISELVNVFKKAKNMSGPILIHVRTTKGKGYKYAELLPWEYHGVGTFDIKTGKSESKSKKPSYSDVFGRTMVYLGKYNKKIVAISAAMMNGTGLDSFNQMFPKRTFDVAIAEQHAVTFAAGLACSGYIPVFAVYSTFLQRAYDQIVHDVCMQNLHVIFAIDRAGIVGPDGATHHGVFDISFLSHIPNITIMSPKNGKELKYMLEFAADGKGPYAIRYPKGEASDILEYKTDIIQYGKSEIISEGKNIAIIAVGAAVEIALKSYDILKEKGVEIFVVNARFIKPIDLDMIDYICSKCGHIFTVEDNVKIGGFGEAVLNAVNDGNYNTKVNIIALPDEYISHGSRNELLKKYGIDSYDIAEKIFETAKENKYV